MISEETRRLFQTRYYKWALNDFYREIDEGFPYLSTFKSGIVPRLLAHFSHMALEDQRMLAAALVKRLALPASEHLTTEEKYVLERYRDVTRWPLPQEAKLFEAEIARDRQAKLNRRRFSTMVRQTLAEVFGDKGESVGAGTWRYTIRHGPWLIITYGDTGGRYHQLSYDHSISAGAHVYLIEHISLLSWLGIAGQTEWSNVYDADASELSECLGRLCKHFLKALPALLDRLYPLAGGTS